MISWHEAIGPTVTRGGVAAPLRKIAHSNASARRRDRPAQTKRLILASVQGAHARSRSAGRERKTKVLSIGCHRTLAFWFCRVKRAAEGRSYDSGAYRKRWDDEASPGSDGASPSRLNRLRPAQALASAAFLTISSWNRAGSFWYLRNSMLKLPLPCVMLRRSFE